MRFALTRHIQMPPVRSWRIPVVAWFARGETRELNQFLGYAIACVLIGILFLDKTPIRTLFYVATLLPMVRYLDRGTLRKVARVDYWWMAVGLAALSLVSLAWSNPASLETSYDAARIALIVALFVTGATRVAQTGHLPERFLFRALVVTAVAAAAVTIAYRFWTGELLDPGYRLRGFGFSANPVLGASLYGFAATAAMLLAVDARALRDRVLFAAAVCICLFFVILTASRGPTLALLVASAVLAVLHSKRLVAILLTAGVGIGVLADSLGLVNFAEWIERGSNSRFLIWEQVTRQALEAPLIGLGAATPIDVTTAHLNSAHNVFLALFYHLGVVGALVFFAISVLACIHAVKSAYRRDYWPLTLFAYGYTILFIDTQNIIINLSREWLIFWLPLLMVIARHRADPVTAGAAPAERAATAPPRVGTSAR